MVADLREMRENQRFSENQIDKSRFAVLSPLIPDVSRALRCTDALYLTILDHPSKHSLYCSRAYIRMYSANIRLGDRDKASKHSCLYTCSFCDPLSMNDSKSLVQFLVTHIQHRKEILHEWEIVVLIFVPSGGGALQCIVIQILIFVDLLFKRDIFTCVKSVLI